MSETWEPEYAVRGRVVADPIRLRPVPGGVAEPAPIACPHGHRLSPNQATVGWLACSTPDRGGHRTHTCLRCRAAGVDDPTIYTPPLDDDCRCAVGTRRLRDASNPA